MDESLRIAVGELTGGRVESWAVPAGGYTHAARFVVTLVDGRRVFVKGATDELTAGWLRAEHQLYTALAAPFVPVELAWCGGERPVLVLEALSGAHWPPPWRPGDIERVWATLNEVAVTPPPAGLPELSESFEDLHRWPVVAADPEPFLSIGLAGRAWLEGALPALEAASAAADLRGTALVHGDVRSDNLCLAAGRVVLVDWNMANIGNPDFDVAAWLPSLETEGGPRPEEVVGDGYSELAAMVAGYFAANAGLPVIPHAPRVRVVQRAQLGPALRWACRQLGLPSPRP